MTIMATSLALWVFVATRQLYLCGMGSQGEFIHTSVIRPIVIMMITSLVIITDMTPTCLLNTIKYRKGNEGKGDLLVMIEKSIKQSTHVY